MSTATSSLVTVGPSAEPRTTTRRWRVVLGLVLLLHGLAHSSAITWAGEQVLARLFAACWAIALWGYLAAGFGLLGVPGARRIWQPAMTAAMGASMVLLTLVGGAVAFAGAVIDMSVLAVLIHWTTRQADTPAGMARSAAQVRGHRIAKAIGLLALVYVSAVIIARPLTTTWGTTTAERAMALPGDAIIPDAHYRLDHAITINAPADSVWPWLAQIGQDRGGFYSLDWLERLVGDDVHNADRIHPEWQQIAPGDFVRATQSTWLWGLGENMGWPVHDVVPGRALILENWGAFVLVPIDDTTTRFFIRSRGDGRPALASVVFGPVSVFVFEPAHFIMQRAMMLGIQQRAERMVRPPPAPTS